MGVYIYSLRKKHKECDLMGITPVKVMSFDFAYRLSDPWPGDYDYRAYKAMEARTEANALRASDAHRAAAIVEHGTDEIPYYIVWGDFVEGALVYKTEPGKLPLIQDDSRALRNATAIGYLFKVGRRWSIEKECPGHKWSYEGCAKGDFRVKDGGLRAPMLPARSCTRCSKMEYQDADLQAQYEEYQNASQRKAA